MRKNKSLHLVLNAASAVLDLPEVVHNKVLTTKARKDLSDSDFALPEERKYPIPDAAHARNALARVAQHGTDEEKKKVRAAVKRKFPDIDVGGGSDNTKNAEGVWENLTFNITPGSVKQRELGGVQYTVVPMVMITEGVHNGSNGPIYYPPEELGKTPVVWNHKPIVVYHPEPGRSATEPAMLEVSRVGIILNTKYEAGKAKQPGKLKAEAWLETARLARVDERLAEAVQNRETMEVSTGLFMDFEAQEGVWNGEDYDTVGRNFRPDHLAILPDQKGACSRADGAGLLRNAEGGGNNPTAMSHSEIHDGLTRALQADMPDTSAGVWPVDIFPDFFVYRNGDKLYKQDYSASKGQVSLNGVPEEVTRKLQYRTVSGTVLNTGEPMNKQELVAAIIANKANTFGEGDAAWLGGLTEPQLKKMLPDDGAPVTNKDTPAPVTTTVTAPKQQTLDDILAAARPEVRELITNGVAMIEQEKRGLITAITANEANTFTKEYLEKQPLEVLRALGKLAVPQGSLNPTHNYTGMGDVIQNAQPQYVEDEVLEMPVMNFANRTGRGASRTRARHHDRGLEPEELEVEE